ncbi:MAG: multiheme c-type cytochrome [Armatimonas sp.]
MRLCSRTILGAMLPVLAVVLLSCVPQPKKAVVTPTEKKLEPVGSEACAPCHADIAEKHKSTNHSITLYPATLSALKKLAPPESEMRYGMMLRREGDKLAVEVKNPVDGTLEQVPLVLALGSGKTAMTYLIEDGGATTEISRSYFLREKAWFITPGQEDSDPTLIGQHHDQAVTRKCLSCHAVTSPDQPLIPDRKFFGVGCESCHGYGSAHIQGAKMQDLKKLDGTEMNELCGRCHRTTEGALTMGPSGKDSTNRFQPHGLSLSKCFIKSQGKLSCVTCHDPHENASLDIPKYERTCIACHDGSVKTKPVCPVNAKQGCIRCHMPQRDVFPGEPKLPITMPDHFIRIFKNSATKTGKN